jgi:hypothetical protein
MTNDQETRLRLRMEALDSLATDAAELNYSDAMVALDVCRKALRRVVARNEAEGEWEQFDIVQTEGPTLQFCGKVLAAIAAYDTSVIETRAGALAVWLDDGVESSATVIPPSDDPQSMHLKVMDAFGWSNAARAMAKKLGWDLRLEVL